MNPILNLSPAASTASGSAAATPESTGASSGAAPAGASFETVMAGQETTSGAAGKTLQGESLPASGGKARQPAGKELPGMTAGEAGQAVATNAGVDLQLPPADTLISPITDDIVGGSVGDSVAESVDALLATADGEAVITAAVTDPLAPALTIKPETTPPAPGWAIYPTAIPGSATAVAVDAGPPAVQSDSLVAYFPQGQAVVPGADTGSTPGQAPAAPTAGLAGSGLARSGQARSGQQAAALLQSLAQAGTGTTQPAGGAEQLVQSSTIAPAALGLGQKSIGDPAGSDSRPLYRPVGAAALAPVAVDAVEQLESVVAAGTKWRPVPGLEQAALRAGAGAELFEVAAAAEAGQPKVAPTAVHATGQAAAFGAALSPLETGILSATGRPEAMTHSPGQANWGNEFAGRVTMLVKNGVSEARLQLNPAELGHLEVKISTEGDRAVVMFSAQQLATREAIDAAMPRLREMLEQSGLQLAHSEVSDQSRSPQQDGGSPGELARDGFGRQLGEDDEALAADGSFARLQPSDSNSLIDYYA